MVVPCLTLVFSFFNLVCFLFPVGSVRFLWVPPVRGASRYQAALPLLEPSSREKRALALGAVARCLKDGLWQNGVVVVIYIYVLFVVFLFRGYHFWGCSVHVFDGTIFRVGLNQVCSRLF